MTLDFLNKMNFPFGSNVEGNVTDKDASAWGIVNKLIELATGAHATLASPHTTAASGGAFEDVVSATITPTYDDHRIVAEADLEFESAGTAAAVLKARVVIGSDNGQTYTVDVPNTDTDSRVISVGHDFDATEGTTYTVKLQVADDGTTAQTVSVAALDVHLEAVQS